MNVRKILLSLVYCLHKSIPRAGKEVSFVLRSLLASDPASLPHCPPPPMSHPLLGSLALALRLKAINFAGLLLPWHIFACLSFKTIFIIVAAVASEGGVGMGEGVARSASRTWLICILSRTSRKLKMKTKPKLGLALNRKQQ